MPEGGAGEGGGDGERRCRAFTEATGSGVDAAKTWLRLAGGCSNRAADLFFERQGALPAGEARGRGGTGEGAALKRAGEVLEGPTVWERLGRRKGVAAESFRDKDFPAGPRAVDGRGGGGAAASPPKCSHGVPARLRTVFKDGPNQGRLFYSCGKASRGSPASEKCDFFAWCVPQEAPHTSKALSLKWRQLTRQEHPVVQKSRGFLPGDVRQGKIGDCWFIAALAVIAERPDLIERVIPPRPDEWAQGCYPVHFFFDGRWEIVNVDGFFPYQGDRIAFARGANNQLWPSLIEKAYAKAHGSYSAISGGFISEAMLNLTGWPTATFVFDREDFDAEIFFAQLLSFVEAGFPLGCSTSVTQQGLVGCHAYSLLEVRQISAQTGKQMTLKSALAQGKGLAPHDGARNKGPLRLLKIRNPWGRREWTGQWSAQSEIWTKNLKAELGHTMADDGVFWMEYGDFLATFDTVDVCKARRDWNHQALWPAKQLFPALPEAWPTNAVDQLPQFTLRRTSEVSILLVQPTKRGKGDFRLAHSSRRLWYSDLHVAVVQNFQESGRKVLGWFSGAALHVLSVETILPEGQYTLVIFSLSPGGGAVAVSLVSSQMFETSQVPKSVAVASGAFLLCVQSCLGLGSADAGAIKLAADVAGGGKAASFKSVALRPGLELVRVTGRGTLFFSLINLSKSGAAVMLLLETSNMEVFQEEHQQWVPPLSARCIASAVAKSRIDFHYTYSWELLASECAGGNSPGEGGGGGGGALPRGLFRSRRLSSAAPSAPPDGAGQSGTFFPSGKGSLI